MTRILCTWRLYRELGATRRVAAELVEKLPCHGWLLMLARSAIIPCPLDRALANAYAIAAGLVSR